MLWIKGDDVIDNRFYQIEGIYIVNITSMILHGLALNLLTSIKFAEESIKENAIPKKPSPICLSIYLFTSSCACWHVSKQNTHQDYHHKFMHAFICSLEEVEGQDLEKTWDTFLCKPQNKLFKCRSSQLTYRSWWILNPDGGWFVAIKRFQKFIKGW